MPRLFRLLENFRSVRQYANAILRVAERFMRCDDEAETSIFRLEVLAQDMLGAELFKDVLQTNEAKVLPLCTRPLLQFLRIAA